MAAVMTSSEADVEGDDPRRPWRPSPGGAAARIAVLALLVVAAVAAPLIVPDVQADLVTNAFVFGIIALSMNILIGYVGSVSLGHQAFVGMGAYTAGFILTDLQLPWLVAVAGAIVLGAAQAALIGVVALRVQGFFFAIVTLAYGLFAKDVLFNITAITGGGAGQEAARPAFTVPPEGYTGPITGDVRYAWLALAFLVLVWLFDWRLTSSRGGRAIQALRDDPRVAASWGINVNAYTLLAFSISGGIAGLAGALTASTFGFISAESFTLTTALTYVLMTTVGGVGSRPGVVIGGFVFAGLGPILTAMHETDGWGVGREAFGEQGAIEVCSSGGAQVTAVILGLMLIGAGLEALRELTLHEGRSPALRAIGGVAFLVAVALGLVVGLGAVFGGYCIFTSISALLEPVIGVVLLLVTLIAFPGGIAEQLEDPLRWLSFGKFHGDKPATVGIGGATDDSETH